jgi:hypothetical protein
MPARIVFAFAVAALLGCASSPSSTGAPRNRALLTAEEITEAHVTNAFDAVEQLRPLWLRSHGKTSINSPGAAGYANVYVDGQRYGDLSTLRNLAVLQIAEIRYYNGPEGSARFGLQNTSGVIEVRMK